MKVKSKIGVVGRLKVKVYDLENKLVFENTSKNMVVDQGLIAISKLLGGDDPATGKPVAFGRVGDGITAPDASDTSLVNAIAGTYAIDSVAYPATGSVQFNFSLNYGDANGTDITEYALYNEDMVMYARVIKPAISKTISWRVECEWTIEFTVI